MRECNFEAWKVWCVFHIAIKCLQSLHLGHQAWHSRMFTYGPNVVSTPDVFCGIKNILANQSVNVSYHQHYNPFYVFAQWLLRHLHTCDAKRCIFITGLHNSAVWHISPSPQPPKHICLSTWKTTDDFWKGLPFCRGRCILHSLKPATWQKKTNIFHLSTCYKPVTSSSFSTTKKYQTDIDLFHLIK